jgi:hypothetical protein
MEILLPFIMKKRFNFFKVFENNSGWLFTQSAATLFSNIDALCSLKDAQGERTIAGIKIKNLYFT